MQVLENIYSTINFEIKDLNEEQRGEKILEIIHPIASEFLKLLNNSEDMMPLFKSNFYNWANDHECFLAARKLVSEHRLVKSSDNYTKTYFFLEYACASTINYMIGHKLFCDALAREKSLEHAIMHRQDEVNSIETTMRKLLGQCKKYDGIFAPIASKQYCLQTLIEDILNDLKQPESSVYSSGMPGNLLRAILTKKIIQFLWMMFKDQQPKPRLIAKITSHLITLFFNPMDISYTTNLAEEIRKNVINDENFRSLTIDEYLLLSTKGVG